MKTRNLSILVLLSFLSAVPAAQAATYTVNQVGDTGTAQGFGTGFPRIGNSVIDIGSFEVQ